MNTRNYTIDVFRIIGALCVVALHSPLGDIPNSLALLIRLGSRWAVPFFFLVSGYYFAMGLKDKPGVAVGKQVNFLVSIFLVANLMYALLFVADFNPATNIKSSLGGLIIGQQGHLWYISSSIIGFLLLQYAANRFSDWVLLAVAAAVLLLITMGEGYANLLHTPLPYEVSHLLTSIPFLWGGYLLGRHDIIRRYSSVGLSVALIVAGFGLQAGEAIMLYKYSGYSPHNQEMLLGTTLFALGIFSFSLTYQTTKENLLASWGRRYSLLIYLYHVIVLTLLYSVFHLAVFSHYLNWISPLIGFFVCLGLIAAIEKLAPRVFRMISGG